MAKRTPGDIAAHIEREALRAGKRRIDGNKIGSFSQELLSIGEGSLSEHLDIHPTAGLYYYAVLRRAQRIYELRKARFDEWWNKKYTAANERLIEKWGRRPNKVDVENYAKRKNKNSYSERRKELDEAKRNVETISSYVEMWRQKGFSMGQRERSVYEENDGAAIRKHMRKND